MKFGTFLLALVEPMLGKILLALGFSVVSIVGVEVAMNAVKLIAINGMNGLAGIIEFGLYIWLGKGLGVIFGACTFKLTLWNIQNATKILGKSNG